MGERRREKTERRRRSEEETGERGDQLGRKTEEEERDSTWKNVREKRQGREVMSLGAKADKEEEDDEEEDANV
ncbi:hypothetical protein ACOMHN_036341 [Nucella lapillus]